jgi:hypothetical protein
MQTTPWKTTLGALTHYINSFSSITIADQLYECIRLEIKRLVYKYGNSTLAVKNTFGLVFRPLGQVLSAHWNGMQPYMYTDQKYEPFLQ